MSNQELLDKVTKVVNSDFSANFIERESGLAHATISKVRRGERKADNLTISNGIKIAGFYDLHQYEDKMGDLK